MLQMLPVKEASIMIVGSDCNPNQAPNTANNLKSPCPIPCIPRNNVNKYDINHKLVYPVIAPIIAFAGDVNKLKALQNKPSQINGIVISFGNILCSISMKISGNREEVNNNAAKLFIFMLKKCVMQRVLSVDSISTMKKRFLFV